MRTSCWVVFRNHWILFFVSKICFGYFRVNYSFNFLPLNEQMYLMVSFSVNSLFFHLSGSVLRQGYGLYSLLSSLWVALCQVALQCFTYFFTATAFSFTSSFVSFQDAFCILFPPYCWLGTFLPYLSLCLLHLLPLRATQRGLYLLFL